jgi:hypothetical protein
MTTNNSISVKPQSGCLGLGQVETVLMANSSTAAGVAYIDSPNEPALSVSDLRTRSARPRAEKQGGRPTLTAPCLLVRKVL